MKLLLFIILLSSYSFAQNEIIRRTEFEDSLTNIRSDFSSGSITGDTVISGSATINVGADSVIVTHGASSTPLIQNINVTPQENALGYEYWVQDITSTTFKIKLDTSIGYVAITEPLTFSWQVFNASIASNNGLTQTQRDTIGNIIQDSLAVLQSTPYFLSIIGANQVEDISFDFLHRSITIDSVTASTYDSSFTFNLYYDELPIDDGNAVFTQQQIITSIAPSDTTLTVTKVIPINNYLRIFFVPSGIIGEYYAIKIFYH